MIKKILVILLIMAHGILAVSAELIYHGLSPKKVALTFDDGPSPGYTKSVLATLRMEQVPATFFVLGRKVQARPDLLKRIDEEGHEIGNHTYSHARIPQTTDDELLYEIAMTSFLIRTVTGKEINYFRPPHGKLTFNKRRRIEQLGYKVVLWSVNADDYWHEWGMRSPESIANRVVTRTRGGSIVLMHDDSRQTADALPSIIKSLKERGYTFVTLSELLNPNGKVAKKQ